MIVVLRILTFLHFPYFLCFPFFFASMILGRSKHGRSEKSLDSIVASDGV